VLRDRVVRVPGHEQDLHAGPARRQTLRELGSAHAGQHDIRQEKVDARAELLAHEERFARAGGVEDGVPALAQDAASKGTQLLVIFDEQDRLRSALRARRRRVRPGGVRGGGGPGKVHPERRALFGLAVDPDVSLAPGHDPEHGRETEARPPTEILGGEERLEDARARRGIHAGTRVAHGEHHMRAGLDTHVLSRVVGIEIDVLRLHRELATPGHGVPSVHDQVHDHLLDFPPIREHMAERVRGQDGHLDVGTEEAAHHPSSSGDDLVEIEDLR
jgi:hypothetical protein